MPQFGDDFCNTIGPFLHKMDNTLNIKQKEIANKLHDYNNLLKGEESQTKCTNGDDWQE